MPTVVPVPLHPLKKFQRGYNQVKGFGQEIAQSLQADYSENVLGKTQFTSTQVFKNRSKRSLTDKSSFKLKNPSLISGKHLLLVDDIITTGATIEACSSVLLAQPNVKISVAAMAIAE